VRGVPAVRADGSLALGAWLEANGLPAGSYVDLGPVPNAGMGQLVREADVALFPNRCEGGTNLVAMECMASGVPTILAANTGHLDLVDGGCIVLERQGAVRPTGHFAGTEGWGESDVEEVLEALEWAYARRGEAAEVGAAGALSMRGLTWSHQVDQLLEAVGDLL
jgi:glycosyltransferase involved in cell wall biosynthesis